MPATNAKPKSVRTRKKPITSLTKKLKLYHVIWRDAFTEEDIWHDADSIKSEDYICETVGFLIEDNNKPNYITIASTATHDEYYCSVINIPKSMIIKQTILKVSNPK